MGAWSFVAPRLREALGGRWPLRYLGRPDRSSPAEGSTERYEENQAELVDAAFAVASLDAQREKDGVVVYAD